MKHCSMVVSANSNAWKYWKEAQSLWEENVKEKVSEVGTFEHRQEWTLKT